jgi:hypothetical protein
MRIQPTARAGASRSDVPSLTVLIMYFLLIKSRLFEVYPRVLKIATIPVPLTGTVFLLLNFAENLIDKTGRVRLLLIKRKMRWKMKPVT